MVDVDPFCFNFFFQGPLVVAVIMISDGSEKSNRKLGFDIQSLHVIERHSKGTLSSTSSILIRKTMAGMEVDCNVDR